MWRKPQISSQNCKETLRTIAEFQYEMSDTKNDNINTRAIKGEHVNASP